MSSIRSILSGLLASVIGILVIGLLATIVFAVAIFVVSTGAGLAGYEPSADYVVLSAALVVVAVILTGGFTPRLSGGGTDEDSTDQFDDRTFN
ncbi:hypothetical protein GS429_06295 [Natronorubrum sp. JWXQ-INN-674]|uniref:Major facilitator superfamily (MFS) profile domain-containing protein n=1 Tax=Natronorubrum halalkaliphilum TaxID=2691917 RepID=A0A6B0VM78_9EURY|nr:hypothetical protein [Natronorubrum halalkaliphilum]MXV61679.1 hypothetical protein [Natronorubrum halalkaliphilum]